MPLTQEQSPGNYLTITQAAQLLGVSTRTILRYEAAGRLAAYRLPSGHRRFDRADVLALKVAS